MRGPCPCCGDQAEVVEGLCWNCGYRRGWPVEVNPEPLPDPRDVTDQELITTLEDPIV